MAEAALRVRRDRTAELERYQALSRINNELRYLEMHLTDHPMHVLRSEADRYGFISISRLPDCVESEVRFAGVVAATRRIPTAKGPMQFITFEDEDGLVEAQLAAEDYPSWEAQMTTPGPFAVVATVVERSGVVSLAIKRLLPFHQRDSLS